MNLIKYLESIESKGIKMGLERTKKLAFECGNPHKKLPIIQVVGTNGKGSISAILSNIFKNSGYKTGLFTSPHLVNLNERIRINGLPILTSEIKTFLEKYKISINKIDSSFFEVMTIMAFWYFYKKKVDIAIMETGLGGRLDSVSICNPKILVFSPISYDHIEILGPSLEKITIEKAGAIKNKTLCVSSPQKKIVKNIMKKEAFKKNAPLVFVNKRNSIKFNIGILGNVQQDNAAVALKVIQLLKNYNISDNSINSALKKLKWYGRNQIISKKPLIIFDVAHNHDAILNFLKFYNEFEISGTKTLLIGLQNRKNISDNIKDLVSSFNSVVITQTFNKNSMDCKFLESLFKNLINCTIVKNPELAINKIYSKLNKNDSLVILGSHYLGPSVSKIFKISFDAI